MRSLLSILLIGVPVTLILSLVGLSHGMLEDSQRRARGIGADILVRAGTSSSVISFSGASIDERLVPFIEKQPHVKLAMGVISQVVDLPVAINGIDLATFDKMSGGFAYRSGGPLKDPDDILIDNIYADQHHLKTGDTLTLMNHPWHVRGIIESGKLQRLVVSVKALQDLTSNNGKISQVYVKLDDPSNAAAAVQQLSGVLGDVKVNTMEEWTSMFNINNIHGLREFIIVIMSIGVIIGFAVVCLSMYMAVLQRTREIGILKSLGGSQAFILQLILFEALLLGVGGTILGIIMSFGAYWLIATLVPASIPMVIVPLWWPIAGGITLMGAGLGALYPGLSAARHDPIEALAYE